MTPHIFIGQQEEDAIYTLMHFYPKTKIVNGRYQILEAGVAINFTNSILTSITKL
jgi:hypothetical protein